MADRFNDDGIRRAIEQSGLSGANAAEVEAQESGGQPANFNNNPEVFSTLGFSTGGAVTPPDNTQLFKKDATGATEIDKLQWRVDFGNGMVRVFRIDNIGATGIDLGEQITLESGSLDCGTAGLANIINDGLSNVTIDVEVIDNGGTVQKEFTNVSYFWDSAGDEFELSNAPLQFQNNTGSDFTIDTLKVTAGGDFFFDVNRNDQVVDGAEVDIDSLKLSITNLSS